ncbi:hypothetical protein GA0070607_4936 [Micromonospora coriariae]|uniref:Uncharacterized protein n=1 Tax=Micromonospora coriariae TaxID=285665 RepID=A0A1C4XAE0_9ACTN|nr:hypothetical protein GA0070607_4936 [Micromonospora coriariae]
MSEREQHRDADRIGVPQDAAAKRTRAAQDAHGGSMAPGVVDDTGHPVTAAPADRVADTDGDGSVRQVVGRTSITSPSTGRVGMRCRGMLRSCSGIV